MRAKQPKGNYLIVLTATDDNSREFAKVMAEKLPNSHFVFNVSLFSNSVIIMSDFSAEKE